MADSTKEAQVKLTLDNKNFTAGLKDVEKQAKDAGDRGGSALGRGLMSGLKGAEGAVKSMFGTIKNMAVGFAGLGSVMGGGALLKSAMDAEGVFKRIAFSIRMGTGETVNFRDMMNVAQQSAVKWGQDIEGLGHAMDAVYKGTGSKDVATGTIDTIAKMARLTKEPVENLGTLAGTLSKKFKISNGEMSEAMTTVFSAANKGGATIEELLPAMEQIGAVAHVAGFEGKAGLEKMMGMLLAGDEGAKNLRKNIVTVGGVLQELGNKKSAQHIGAVLGIDAKDMTGGVDKAMAAMMKKTGGSKDKLAVAFKNEAQLDFMVDVGKSYAKAFADTKGTVKEKTEAGLAALQDAIGKAGKAAMSQAEVDEEAAKAMKSGKAQMDSAMQEMVMAFSSPEMTKAIGELGKVLPPLVHEFAGLANLALAHPVLGAAGAVAGVGLKGAAGVGIDAAMKAGGSWASGAIRSAFGIGGKAAADSVAAAGPELAKGLASGAPEVGNGIAGSAGPLIAAAVAAAIAVKLAKNQYDKLQEEAGEHGWSDMHKKLMHDLGVTSDDEYEQSLGIEQGKNYDNARAFDAANTSRGRKDDAMASGAMTGDMEASYAANASLGYSGTIRHDPQAKAASRGGSGGQQQRSAQDAALFQQMIASTDRLGERTLKVVITNPEDLRGSGGTAPGYEDRP